MIFVFKHVVYLYLHEKWHFCMNSTKSIVYALTKLILCLENVFIFQVFLSLLSFYRYIKGWSQYIDNLHRLPDGMSWYIA